MKKFFILLTFLLFGAGLYAQQTSLTEAVDFTVTDCHGQTYNLFEILDRGQAVFIDFFFNSCGQCQTISPYITGSYTQMGCNMHDVFYIEISYIDSDAVCQQWADRFGVEFPTVGREGGGNEVFDLYGIMACPTLVLIMPDRSIPIQGLMQLYPMSVQDVVSAMQRNGLQPHDCTGTLTVNPQTMHIYNDGETYQPGHLTIANKTAEDVTVNAFTADPIFALDCQCEGDDVTDGMTVFAGQTVTVDVYVDVPVKMNFEGKLYVNTSAGNFEVDIIYEMTADVEENSPTPTLFPNPANESVTLRGDNLSTVSIFNALGQKVDTFFTKEDRLEITTAKYPNGIYFVKTSNGKTQRLVIAHD
ncbi:MAG: T9SS type A sorting domain-containing protein [Bacteroidales bacterium]|nr:T9SS type A sorting domain-containing protein [Bacteroidales bacterium]